MTKRLNALLFLLIGITFSAQAQMVVGNQKLYGNEWIDYTQTYVKIPVGQDGIYRLTSSALQAAGVPLSTVAANRFQLMKMGQEVPIYTTAETTLGANDYIEFWGEKNRSELDAFMYKDGKAGILNPDYSYCNDTAMYFLTWRATPSTNRYRIVANNLANLPTPEAWFWHTEKYSPSDFAIWQDISGGNHVHLPELNAGEGYGTNADNLKSKVFAPQFIAAGQAGQLQVRWTGNYKNHNTVSSLNGAVLARDTVNGVYLRERTYNLEASQISAYMDVRLTGTADAYDYSAVGGMSLKYARQFNFGASKIFNFTIAAATGVKYLEITNFNAGTSAPVLYDLTNNQRIQTTLENGLVKIALPPSVSERKLVLVAAAEVQNVSTIKPVTFTDVKSDGGNYIMITPLKFLNDGTGKNYVQEFADYRSSAAGGSFKSKIIDIEQLYDQFAYGIRQHPMSIRNYAQFIKKNWTNPQYLVLVGKAVEYVINRADLSNIVNKIDVPTWGYPGGDILLVTNDSSIVPIIPIGRIPLTNPADLKTYLEKVKEHENGLKNAPQTLADRDWMKNVMHLGGGGDVSPQIKEYLKNFADTLSASKAGLNVTSFYKTSLDPVQTVLNNQVFEYLNKGASLITFYGHSATTVLDFDINTPDFMTNKGKYPMFLALGCAAGNCHQQGLGLGESLIFYKDKGMSSFCGTSGSSYLNSLNTFASELYRSIGTNYYGERLGDITKGTMSKFSHCSFGNIAQTFTVVICSD